VNAPGAGAAERPAPGMAALLAAALWLASGPIAPAAAEVEFGSPAEQPENRSGPVTAADAPSPTAAPPPTDAVAPATEAAAPRLPAGEPWTLSRVALRALEQHPAIGLARSQSALARADLATAEADRRPSLSFGASAFRYQEPMLVTPIHGFLPSLIPDFDPTLLQAALQARYELWDGGSRAAQVDQRVAQVAAADASLAAEEQLLVARAVSLYLRALGLVETHAAHAHRVAALEVERQRVERLLAVGRAADVDARRVEAALAAAEADRVAVGAALDTAERDLARILAVDPSSTRASNLSPLSGAALSPPDREALLAAALAGSPTVARAREEALAADAAVRAARAARWPSLRLEGNYLGFADDDGTATAEWNAGLRVGLPLVDGRVGAQLARAEATAQASAERLRLAELQVAAELDRALSTHTEAAARAGALAEAVERYAEVVRVERLRLEVGVGVQRDYLAAEADLLAANASLVEARHAATTARVEAARVAGTLSADWLRNGFEAAPAVGVPPTGAPQGE
jgi:outer membrane protein TolC